jgi:hypothetical protein
MNRFLSIAPVAFALVLVVCQRSEAQSLADSFAGLPAQLKPGDSIFVTDRQGRETSGKLARLSPASLVIVVNGEEREILSATIGRIEKRGDSVRNGAWIGAAYFAVASQLNCTEPGGNCQVAAIVFGPIGAGIGALVDKAIPGRTLVYGTRRNSRHALRSGSPVSSFSDLWTRIQTGDGISVIDTNGRKTMGTFAHVSTSSIALQVDGQLREFPVLEVRQLARRGNRMWQGMLLGAAAGAAVGVSRGVATGCGAATGCSVDRPAGAVGGFFGGGTLGAITGALIPRHMVIYRSGYVDSKPVPDQAIRVMPVIAPSRRGLFVLIQF